jgi:hypothetical protein
MAINPLIALQGQTADIGQTFSNVLMDLHNIDQIKRGRAEAPIRQQMLEAAQQQQQQQAPIQNRLLEAQTRAAEAQLPTQQQQFNAAQLTRVSSLAQAAKTILPDLEAGNTDRVIQTLSKRRQDLIDHGIKDTSDTDEALQLAINNPQELQRISMNAISAEQQINPVKRAPMHFSGQSIGKDSEGNLFAIMTKSDPESGTTEPVLTHLSGDPSVKPIGKISLVDALGQTVSDKIQNEAKTAAQKTEAELAVKFKLEPKVQAAVGEAVKITEMNVKNIGQNKSNDAALAVYDTAIKGLAESLGKTVTGPVAGWLPAMTDDQQAAEGALAVMAPVLKGIFRASGEGTFTKDDQEVLMRMLPTRKDTPAARKSKLASVDAVVRAKLANVGAVQPPSGAQQAQPAQQTAPKYQEGQTATNPATGAKIIFKGGRWQTL